MAFNVSRLGRYELRRFRGPLGKASLIFVMLVPLLYATIYLTANWDPYGRVKDLPVAVVNADQPATANGRPVTAGNDLVTKLVDGHAFDWHVTDAATAAHGLAEGTYYLVLTIPPDFSANLVSGSGDDPQRAVITMRRDDANGYVVGNITKTAQNSIVQAVDQSAQESYFNAVFANLATIRSGLADASEGAGTLADGTAKAHTGAQKLDRGSADAVSGAKDLSTGAGRLASGLDTARTGATSLANGLGKLDTGSANLSSGARQVAHGTQQLRDQVVPPLTDLEKALPDIEQNAKTVSGNLDDVADQVAGRSDSVAGDLGKASGDLAALAKKYPQLADDPAFARVKERVGSASDRADDIARTTRSTAKVVDRINDTVQDSRGLTGKVTKAKKDIIKLDDGAQRVASGAASLHTGINNAASGAKTLATGIASADDGAQQLASGSDTLYDGLVSLRDGAASLNSGLGQLATGSRSLATQLDKAYHRIPVVSADQQADAVQVLSSPATVDSVVDHAAVYNGRGFAPLFLAVSLWVFGISAFQVLRPISNRILAGRANPVRRALAAWVPTATLSVLAGWLMVGSVWLFLGLDPTHPGLLLLTVTLGALCFSAIAQLLMVALGTVGSSLLLVTLLLQLSASGGTYPGYLLPPFFAAIGPFLPLTYLINSYRVAITGGPLGHYLHAVLILAAVLLAALGLLVLVVRRRGQFRLSDLHPPTATT